MKIVKAILILILIVGIQPLVIAKEKLRVLDKGMDGNKRTYLITCPDGTYSSVFQEFEKREPPASTSLQESGVLVMDPNATKPPKSIRVCISSRSGKDICRSRWDIDAAARASCQP